jgi:metal-responsive CopG/Arc/MetJ family transcriptional regulator
MERSVPIDEGYRRAPPGGSQRVVLQMPKAEAEAVDNWGIPAGMPSRSSAVRYLLRQGLEAVKVKENRHSAG